MSLPDIFDPKHLALLVIDKQAAYFDPKVVEQRDRRLTSRAINALANIEDLISFMRSKQIPVIWTKMIEDRELSPPNIALKMQRDDYVSISNPKDASFDFVGETKPTSEELVITKKYYDAFSGPQLRNYLQKHDITTLIIVGGYATRCVLATIVGANNANLHTVVPQDCVANQAAAEHELESFYEIVEAIFGYVTDADTIKNTIH